MASRTTPSCASRFPLLVGVAEALAATAEDQGFHKLIGKLFTDNLASIGLVERCGFDSVGMHRRHGRLDGDWRDVLVVEQLLGEPA